MSELTNARAGKANFRWQLLATVSAIALTGAGFDIAKAADSDSDHPLVWIELGGQLSRISDGQETFAPAFMTDVRPSMFSPSQPFERPSLYSIDETGKISFQPEDSNWILSASVRFGRSASNKDEHQQTHPNPVHIEYYSLAGVPHVTGTRYPVAARFADTNAQNSEKHSILDFQVGRDFGLGMFGKDGSSVFNAGVRFAQFSTKSNIALKSDPDFHITFKYGNYPSLGVTNIKIAKGEPFHSNAASLIASRSFHGIGPSLSWNASAPFLGNSQAGELVFDWGLNAAILFGRRRAKVHHQATGRYHSAAANGYRSGERVTVYQPTPVDRERIKSITVPNVGAFAGLSFRVQNVKVSAGYRADLFFDAMDGGIDTAKKENVGFYGPFASVSIGIGG